MPNVEIRETVIPVSNVGDAAFGQVHHVQADEEMAEVITSTEPAGTQPSVSSASRDRHSGDSLAARWWGSVTLDSLFLEQASFTMTPKLQAGRLLVPPLSPNHAILTVAGYCLPCFTQQSTNMLVVFLLIGSGIITLPFVGLKYGLTQ